MPNSIVDKPSFRNLIAALNPRYIPPGKVLLAKEINKLYLSMSDVIKYHLSSATTIHFTTDLWTKKDLTSSYLGITAHFFSHNDSEYHSVLLAMRYIEELHHTAVVVADIFKQVVMEWNVSSDQVDFIVTDNGSNIVKAFRDDFFQDLADSEAKKLDEASTQPLMHDEANTLPLTVDGANTQPLTQDEADTLPLARDGANTQPLTQDEADTPPLTKDEADTQEDEADTLPLTQDETDTPPLTKDEADTQEDEADTPPLTQDEAGTQAQPLTLDEPNTQVDESDIQPLDTWPLHEVSTEANADITDDGIMKQMDEDVVDFDTCDSEHAQQFEEVGYGKRLSCYAHTIQLVVTSFNKDPYVRSLVTEVYRVVKKVKSSTVATGKLLRLCNKKLLSHCPTRWSSTFLVLQHLLEVKEPLIQVLQEMEWSCTIDWVVLTSVVHLLCHFALSTTLLSGDKYATLSSVVVDIINTTAHLNKFIEDENTPKELIPVANIMKEELNRRFGKYTDPKAADCDPIYLMALLLNPAEAILLNEDQLKCASKELIQYMKRRKPVVTSEAESSGSSMEWCQSDNGSENSSNGGICEPPSKRSRQSFHAVRQFSDMLIQQKVAKLQKRPPREIEIEVEKYAKKVQYSRPTSKPPLKYWIERYQHNKESVLILVALDVLSAPASSAPAERMFSVAGEITGGRRNRLEKENLEREVLLRKNE